MVQIVANVGFNSTTVSASVGSTLRSIAEAGHTETSYTILGGSQAFVYSGTELLYNSDPKVVSGTVTQLEIYNTGPEPDFLKYTISNLNVDVFTVLMFPEVLGTIFNGADQFFGSSQVDTFLGSGGKDTLRGFGGADKLTGGRAKDMLYGGGGGDKFIYTALGDSGKTAAARDEIKDFKHGQHDKIHLGAIDAKSGPGNQGFTFIGNQPFHHVKGELRFASHVLSGDTNGDGKPDFTIWVNANTLVQGDFLL